MIEEIHCQGITASKLRSRDPCFLNRTSPCYYTACDNAIRDFLQNKVKDVFILLYKSY